MSTYYCACIDTEKGANITIKVKSPLWKERNMFGPRIKIMWKDCWQPCPVLVNKFFKVKSNMVFCSCDSEWRKGWDNAIKSNAGGGNYMLDNTYVLFFLRCLGISEMDNKLLFNQKIDEIGRSKFEIFPRSLFIFWLL